MILDKQDAFLTTDASETLGGYESGVSDYKNFESAGALDTHKKVYLNLKGVSDLTASGSETITIALVSDTDSGFATAKAIAYSSGAIAKGAVAALNTKILLPEGLKSFVRIEWTISGTSTAGGAFRAFLSNN